MNIRLLESLIPEDNAETANDDRTSKVELLKKLRFQLQKYVEKGGLTRKEAEEYIKLAKEADSIYYDIERPLSLDKILPPEQRQSTLPSDIVLIARQDIRRSKLIYSAITMATHGVWHSSDTPIDDIMLGKNPEVSPQDLYNAFDRTREAMKRYYGNTIKLFRAIGTQKQKPTTNWATTYEFARQFGNNVISKDVQIENIIAVQVRGTYHEIIVGQPPTNLKESIYRKYMVQLLKL